jgi:hypothetical protein
MNKRMIRDGSPRSRRPFLANRLHLHPRTAGAAAHPPHAGRSGPTAKRRAPKPAGSPCSMAKRSAPRRATGRRHARHLPRRRRQPRRNHPAPRYFRQLPQPPGRRRHARLGDSGTRTLPAHRRRLRPPPGCGRCLPPTRPCRPAPGRCSTSPAASAPGNAPSPSPATNITASPCAWKRPPNRRQHTAKREKPPGSSITCCKPATTPACWCPPPKCGKRKAACCKLGPPLRQAAGAAAHRPGLRRPLL